MRLLAPLLAVLALVPLVPACKSGPDYERPLPPGWPALLKLGPNDPRPDFAEEWQVRGELLEPLVRSIGWMQKPSSPQFFPLEGIEHAHAAASLVRFHDLLRTCQSGGEFNSRLNEEFDVYKSAGWNGEGGGVLFTGYYTPILKGSLEPVTGFEHPLYGLPDDLEKGPTGEILGLRTQGGLRPYPTRREIEEGRLLEGRGLEIVWLQSPLDAFIAHVNGSAFVELPDGSMARFGYAAKNGREYTSLGKALIKDKQLRAKDMSLAGIRKWAAKHPDRVQEYLRRNDSYVFFTPITGTPRGSLNVEVEPGRSLATDKTLFPRGGVVFVETQLPVGASGVVRPYRRFLLDQDTGGAIRTAGRGDIYMGIGPSAETVAGHTRSPGQLYYLFLKPEVAARLAKPAP